MRDPKRIEPLLALIKEIWEKAPDLRLLQLLLNVAGSDDTAYHLEDHDLIDKLKRGYKDLL